MVPEKDRKRPKRWWTKQRVFLEDYYAFGDVYDKDNDGVYVTFMDDIFPTASYCL